MIQVVEPPVGRDSGEETSLASVGRWALAADAVLLFDLVGGQRRALLACDGLDPQEPVAVRDALDQCDDPLDVPGFGAVTYREERIPDVGASAILALQRRSSSFENLEFAGVFAVHAAVASAVRRHPHRAGRAGAVAGTRATDWARDEVGLEELNLAVAAELAVATGATSAGVLVWDAERNLLCPVPGSYGSAQSVLPPAHAVHDWGSSAARVFTTGEPYLTNCAHRDPGVLQDFVEAFGFERMMTVPITRDDRRVGVLQVVNKRSDFTLDDLHASLAIGQRIAVDVEVAKLRNNMQRARRLEEVFSNMAVHIASGHDLHEFLGAAMDDLGRIVRGSLVALVPFEGEPVLRRHGQERAADHLERTLLAQARATTNLRIYGVGARRAVEPGWSVVHVPVILSGKQAATLSVMRRGSDFFDAEECRAFSRLANLIALSWSTESYQRNLADSARVAERQRIADELHDQLAQLLFAARLSLDQASERDGLPDAAAESIRRSRDLLMRADVATRDIMAQNSQPRDESLPERLAATIGGVEDEFDRDVTLDISDQAVQASRLMSRSALNLVCRTVREALVNAIKHTGPSQLSVRVTVTRRHRMLVTVTDGGIGGGDRRGDGYGTAALRRSVRLHGGLLRVAETATGGTRVVVSLPV